MKKVVAILLSSIAAVSIYGVSHALEAEHSVELKAGGDHAIENNMPANSSANASAAMPDHPLKAQHQSEMDAMHKRHEAEKQALHDKHMNEVKSMHEATKHMQDNNSMQQQGSMPDTSSDVKEKADMLNDSIDSYEQ